MASINVQNTSGKKVAEIDLNDAVFNITVKSSVLHEVVRMQLANRRAGNAAVKHRSDVTGSGRKLFRQKGTGRARRGDIKSPLLRGGGSTFGPDPKSWAIKVPKKVRRQGLKMALSAKLQAEKLVVLDKIELKQTKTRDFVLITRALQAENALFVLDKADENIERSARNIPEVKVLRTPGLNVYDILNHEMLVLVQGSIEDIEGRLLA